MMKCLLIEERDSEAGQAFLDSYHSTYYIYLFIFLKTLGVRRKRESEVLITLITLRNCLYLKTPGRNGRTQGLSR